MYARVDAASALLAVLCLLLGGCVAGVDTTVENRSAVELRNVVVSGKGFSESVGTIAARGREHLSVRPSGESSVRIAFDANGQRYSSESGTIANESSYRALITIDADLDVTIDTNPK
jgi:hypothetical protein